MPGYVIHLAVAKKFMANNLIRDKQRFIKGIIAPDLLKEYKSNSHYGQSSSSPNLNEFLVTNNMEDDYNKAYFLHLLTDYLFYNKYLDPQKWDNEIYNDYDKINKILIDKYKIELPIEVSNKIKFEEGELHVIALQGIINFIEAIGMMDMKDIYEKRSIGENANESRIKCFDIYK